VTSEEEAVGSIGEEAAKLLGALQHWAKQSGGEYADAAAGMASGAAASFDDINEHIATGGQDCRYCPVCQVISAVRDTNPEVKQHLASAATSLLHAATGILSAHSGNSAQHGRKNPGVEKIDLTDDDDWEDE